MNVSDTIPPVDQDLFDRAEQYVQQNDFSAATTYYTMLKNKGYVEAIYQLALCHLNPDWENRSEEDAYKFLREASEESHLLAMNRLGCMLVSSEDVSELPEGADYLYDAAELGLIKAQFNYAECLRQGIGVEKNEEYALSWYESAADNGHPRSAYWIGRKFHQEGDLDKAVHYYNIAKRIHYLPALDGLFEINRIRS